MLILFESRFFFHQLVPHICPCILHFGNSSASLWNSRYSEKGDCLNLLQAPFLCYATFTEIWTHKPHDLTDWQFRAGNRSHVNWSTSPRVTSILPVAIIFLCALSGQFQSRNCSWEVSASIFCVQIWPRQSFHTICFLNLRCARRMIRPAPSPAGFNRPIICKAFSSNSHVRIRPLQILQSFETLVGPRTLYP